MKKGFPDEPDNDMSGDRTIEIVKNIKGFREIISPEEYAADENKFFTFPADAPSRRLDYMFYSEDLRLIQGSIIKSEQIFSDHLPIIARFHMKYME
jgi:endonuclease/exonuclease/phosphatase family metal-dependent hydrolase